MCCDLIGGAVLLLHPAGFLSCAAGLVWLRGLGVTREKGIYAREIYICVAVV